MFVLYCVISCNETEKKEQKKDEIAIENWERQRQQDSINDLYIEHNNIEYKYVFRSKCGQFLTLRVE